jgi:hypothetical protein
MSPRSISLVVKGNPLFVREFERMLAKNNIHYSKLRTKQTFLATREETEKKEGREVESHFYNALYLLTPTEIKEFVIAITPLVLEIIYRWYTSRKKKGEILIRTKEGTVKVNAELIRKFEFKEANTPQSKRRKSNVVKKRIAKTQNRKTNS